MLRCKMKNLYRLMDACYFLGQEHRSTPKGEYLFTQTEKQRLMKAQLEAWTVVEPVKPTTMLTKQVDLARWINTLETVANCRLTPGELTQLKKLKEYLEIKKAFPESIVLSYTEPYPSTVENWIIALELSMALVFEDLDAQELFGDEGLKHLDDLLSHLKHLVSPTAEEAEILTNSNVENSSITPESGVKLQPQTKEQKEQTK